jgi:hypothetical protein
MVLKEGSRTDHLIENANFRVESAKRSPCRDVALVRSLLVLRCSKEQNALYTLIHQLDPTPSCGGHALPRREPWTRQG